VTKHDFVNHGTINVPKLECDLALLALGAQFDGQKTSLYAMETVIVFVLARSAAGVRIAGCTDAKLLGACCRMY